MHRPNPYRRAIAMAIDLERTHDCIAAIIGHSMPMPDRIVPSGKRRDGRKLNLRHPLTLDALNDMSAERLDAIHALHREVGPTMGSGESMMLDDIMEEMRERTSSEETHRSDPKGPSRQIDPEDRMSAEEKMRHDIMRAADAPPPPVSARRAATTPETVIAERNSIAIDLMTEGLIEYQGVDREALYRELIAYRAKLTNMNSSIDLASIAERSNKMPALAALGRSFPPAVFRLRGLSLDVIRLDLPVITEDESTDIWTYRGSGSGRTNDLPSLMRTNAMTGYDLFDFPQRALRDVTGDIRFHDALVVEMTDRKGLTPGSTPLTTITLRRGYSHLDPPTINKSGRIAIRRAADVRGPNQARAAENRDLDHARLIDRLLKERGHTQRSRVQIREGFGLILRIADRGGMDDRYAHTYEIKRDTLDDGEYAIRARVDAIVESLGKAQRKYTPPTMTTHAARSDDDAPRQKDHAPATTTDEVIASRTVAERLGSDVGVMHDRCDRIDALVTDILAKNEEVDDDVEFHSQEGIMAIKRMRLAHDIVYRIEKFDRVLGKATHAVGSIEVERDLSPSAVEALRDGTIKKLIAKWPTFAGGQVRKVTRCDGATVVTVRLPLLPKR